MTYTEKKCCEHCNGMKDITNSCIFCKTYIPRNTENITDADKGIVHFGGESKEVIEAEDRWHDEQMTNTEQRLEKVDWREIDFAIMYFQVHVRKVTGGNDFGFVDSTDLKSAIKQTLNTSINQALAEERERVVAHIKELSGEMRTSETDKILSSLDKENNKFMGIDASSQGLDFDEQLAENERMRGIYLDKLTDK